MRNAIKPLLLTSAFALAACQGKHQDAQDQNIVIDSGNIPANADIEALPPDESSGTSTEELANGADDKAEVRTVKLGARAGSNWIVEEGIAAGERVVVEGFSRAKNGTTVVPKAGA